MYVEGRVLDIYGKPVPKASIETWETDSEGMLPCLAYCIRAVDDKGPKGSTIRNIQIGPILIVEEDCAVTRRVATDTGLLYPWHMLSQVMYADPTLISAHDDDPARLGTCRRAPRSPQSS